MKKTLVTALLLVNFLTTTNLALSFDKNKTLQTPMLSLERPSAGKKVKVVTEKYKGTQVHHTVFLPARWRKGGDPLPIIFEYTGNKYQVTGSSGRVEDANLGYGLSGGEFIWVTLPFVSNDKRNNELTWWGDLKATVNYAKQNVPDIIQRYNADRNNVILTGFSRGAIAVNHIGLFDNDIAKLWSTFVTHDHFDGVKAWPTEWGQPLKKYRKSAIQRLKRVNGRPYLVIQNKDVRPTKHFIEKVLVNTDNFTFLTIHTREIFKHFPNDIAKHPHTDKWLLVPSHYRQKVWQWVDHKTNIR